MCDLIFIHITVFKLTKYLLSTYTKADVCKVKGFETHILKPLMSSRIEYYYGFSLTSGNISRNKGLSLLAYTSNTHLLCTLSVFMYLNP